MVQFVNQLVQFLSREHVSEGVVWYLFVSRLSLNINIKNKQRTHMSRTLKTNMSLQSQMHEYSIRI